MVGPALRLCPILTAPGMRRILRVKGCYGVVINGAYRDQRVVAEPLGLDCYPLYKITSVRLSVRSL
jgi:hypothetical protein